MQPRRIEIDIVDAPVGMQGAHTPGQHPYGLPDGFKRQVLYAKFAFAAHYS
jgi:hypothetical protein